MKIFRVIYQKLREVGHLRSESEWVMGCRKRCAFSCFHGSHQTSFSSWYSSSVRLDVLFRWNHATVTTTCIVTCCGSDACESNCSVPFSTPSSILYVQSMLSIREKKKRPLAKGLPWFSTSISFFLSARGCRKRAARTYSICHVMTEVVLQGDMVLFVPSNSL